MAQASKIEWTESTWNPVTGCTKISPGCRNCYAERLAKRLKAMGQPNYRNGFKVTLHPHVLDVPLHAGVGDAGYARIIAELVWPVLRRFRPDLVLVSAGYDAHWHDPLAMVQLSLTGYARMARELVAMAEELCGGRILFALEGGYDLQVLAHGVLNAFYALLGEETISDPLGPAPRDGPDVEPLIRQLSGLHDLSG